MDLEMYDEAVRDYESANKMDRGNQEVRQLLQQAKLELKKSKRKDDRIEEEKRIIEEEKEQQIAMTEIGRRPRPIEAVKIV